MQQQPFYTPGQQVVYLSRGGFGARYVNAIVLIGHGETVRIKFRNKQGITRTKNAAKLYLFTPEELGQAR